MLCCAASTSLATEAPWSAFMCASRAATGTENRADDIHRRPRRGLPGALPGDPRSGPHHFNFIVTDIEATLVRIRALGIEPVQVNLANPYWKEAFLHPRSAHGIVIQVAQQAGSPRVAAPGELPEPGPAALFDLIEHRVGDLSGATRLFREVLDGRLESGDDDMAELAWPGGKLIRLVREDGLPLGGSLHHVRFSRADGAFSTHDKERAGLLAKRLGLTVELAGP